MKTIDAEDPAFANPTSVQDLLDLWRSKADQTRKMGFEAVARAYERCRRDLKALHWRLHEEEITVEQAAEESGYSEDHLRRLCREGRLGCVKRDGRYRLRRVDLPRKPRDVADHDLYDEPL